MIFPTDDVRLIFKGRARLILDQLSSQDAVAINQVVDEVSILIGRIVENYQIDDLAIVEASVRLVCSTDGLVDATRAATVLTACTFYLYKIGSYTRGINTGRLALIAAQKSKDLNLQRKAHGALGTNHMTACNFEMACHHFEAAFALSLQQRDKSCECAALSNIVVLFLDMGLYQDAIRIAYRALQYGAGTPALASLQLYNACAILKCSHLGCIDANVRRYYLIACKRFKNRDSQCDNLIHTYFEYQRAIYLIDNGKWQRAHLLITRAINSRKNLTNNKVECLLFTAKALCDFASKNRGRTVLARRTLRRLARKTSGLAAHHEDVLHALMRVYTGVISKRGEDLGLVYAQRLRAYIIEMKHVKFLSRSYVDCNSNGSPEALPNCTEEAPRSWLELDDFKEGRAVRIIQRNDWGAHTQLSVICDELARLRGPTVEQQLRTRAFDVAENWAIAAEFSFENDGEHCFRIGKMVGDTARALGFSKADCVQMELAARLHDIGKIAINELTTCGPTLFGQNEADAIREHTIAGERVLNRSSDLTLNRAARIARSHHEWWNGQGYPDGLKGELIPLEARICSVADTYEMLTNPERNSVGWTHIEAVKQLFTMAGIQLDPNLIRPFLKAIEGSASAKVRVAEEVDRSMACNQLARAKKKLFETLELVD